MSRCMVVVGPALLSALLAVFPTEAAAQYYNQLDGMPIEDPNVRFLLSCDPGRTGGERWEWGPYPYVPTSCKVIKFEKVPQGEELQELQQRRRTAGVSTSGRVSQQELQALKQRRPAARRTAGVSTSGRSGRVSQQELQALKQRRPAARRTAGVSTSGRSGRVSQQELQALKQRARNYSTGWQTALEVAVAQAEQAASEADAETEPARNYSTGWQTALEAAVAQAEQAASEAEEIAAGNESWQRRSSACGSASQRAMVANHRWFQSYSRFVPVRDKDTTMYRQLRARLRAAVDGARAACRTISVELR